ncbi:MAG: hypothetical protein ACXW1T_05755 [Methylophilus sp.]
MTDATLKLEQESLHATELLKGKVIAAVMRHRENEVLIQFTDGTRLFLDHTPIGVELSITGGS